MWKMGLNDTQDTYLVGFFGQSGEILLPGDTALSELL